MTERLFSTFQIAQLLGATLEVVNQWVDSGALSPCRMPDGTVQITESALVSFLTGQGIDLGQLLAGVEEPEPATSSETLPVRQLESPKPEPSDKSPWEAILADAIRRGAQSIHITPRRDRVVLQMRIDGQLLDQSDFDSPLGDDAKQQIITSVLNLAGADTDPAALARPLNSEFTHKTGAAEITLGVSAIPTVHGAKIVIRLPLPEADLKLLGLSQLAESQLAQLLGADGLIVVSAKRRIGRDAILGAMLQTADTNGTSVIAVGDFAAPASDSTSLLRIDSAAGLTYSTATAGIERQDADAIVLGELRDPITTSNAFEAAHDGALVIAGTNVVSAGQVIEELRSMGLENWPLGNTLKAVVEQIVVSVLCEHCRSRKDDSSPYEPKGCDRCGQSGWSGRIVLSGIVFVANRLAQLVRNGESIEQINSTIAESCPESLARIAQNAVDTGITTRAQVDGILRHRAD
jgi:general secretion pathway protein E